MVRQTNPEAYKHLVTLGYLPPSRRAVYAYLYNDGPCTAMQIEQGVGSKNANKRTSELRTQGLIRHVGERICPVTGHQADLLDVTDLVTPEPYVAAPTTTVSRKELERQLEELRRENRRLKLELALLQRATEDNTRTR